MTVIKFTGLLSKLSDGGISFKDEDSNQELYIDEVNFDQSHQEVLITVTDEIPAEVMQITDLEKLLKTKRNWIINLLNIVTDDYVKPKLVNNVNGSFIELLSM